jgi:hypothetical protein
VEAEDGRETSCLPFCTRNCAAVTFFFLGAAAVVPSAAFSAFCCSFFCPGRQQPLLDKRAREPWRQPTIDHIFSILAVPRPKSHSRFSSSCGMYAGTSSSRRAAGKVGTRAAGDASARVGLIWPVGGDDGIRCALESVFRCKEESCRRFLLPERSQKKKENFPGEQVVNSRWVGGVRKNPTAEVAGRTRMTGGGSRCQAAPRLMEVGPLLSRHWARTAHERSLH